MSMMFFYFLKIIFDISTSKRSKRYKPHSILAKKKKKLKFAEKQVEQHSQTLPKSRKEIFICRGEAANFGRNSEIGGFFLT
jgi:hypothetical protein